jgi:outer membrane protein TolC
MAHNGDNDGFVGGCMVGPDYQRPSVATPDVFRGSPTPTPDAQSIADLKWFEVFKDEQLQELIRPVLAQNYDLRDAVARGRCGARQPRNHTSRSVSKLRDRVWI